MLTYPAPPLRVLVNHAEPATSDVMPHQEQNAFSDVPRLTAALKRGDEAAFAWLHREWSSRINRYCFALAAGDATFAGEIAQATWLRLVKHVRVMNDEQTLWNWIARAARNAATDFRRQSGRYLQALGRFSEWLTCPPVATSDEAADSLLAALEAALHKLSPEERALLEGRYFTGDSLEMIGQRQSLSARAVEGRLARLRTRLRELIAEELKLHA